MNQFIYVEELTALALINKIETEHTCQISFMEISEYGKYVCQWWWNEKKIHVAVLSDRNYTNAMLYDHKDLYEEVHMDDDHLGIRLRNGKTVDDLRKRFVSYLTVDMLRGFLESWKIYKNKKEENNNGRKIVNGRNY